jgi:tryptophan 2,3-dioxygenase
MALEADIEQKIQLLQEKYAAMGQNLSAYLDGLLHAEYITYWDYIHLDTLLTLQHPKTAFPDEKIFIIYHQITELYFNLALHELGQMCNTSTSDPSFLLARTTRVNRYFEALTHSFAIMVDGMEKEQFLQFRMSLLPASGFQSAQYRKIEMHAAPFERLVDISFRDSLKDANIEQQFEHLYWKNGATELNTGKKTLTLLQFENKYAGELLELAKGLQGKTLWDAFARTPPNHEHWNDLKQALRWLDVNVNINWPLVHYKSAVRYLHHNPEDISATGGTNWQQYLPPRFQRRIFFPELWTKDELENWGKSWVEQNVLNR